MRIGIYAFDIIPGRGKGAGGYVYLYNLLNHLIRLDKDNEYYIFKNPYWNLEYCDDNVKIININFDARNVLLRPFVHNLVMSSLIKRHNIDIIHSPLTLNMIYPLKNCKKVVTVHDMVVFFRKEKWPQRKNLTDTYIRFFLPYMIRNANGVIAISEFTKHEIMKYCGVQPHKIRVIYEGPGISSRNNVTGWTSPPYDRPYFLTVASDRPQKNLINYIKSISLLPDQIKDSYYFVICGMIGEVSSGISIGKDHLYSLLSKNNLNGVVKIPGYVGHDDLISLYKNAFAVIFPSIYEGFGFPVLEAFHFGKPLLCSNAGPLLEIGGNAPLFFNPYDPSDIASRIETIHYYSATDLGLMVQAGRHRLSHFSWEKCAKETIRFYQNVL